MPPGPWGRGTIRRIDLGQANGRYFLQWAGLGLDAEVNRSFYRGRTIRVETSRPLAVAVDGEPYGLTPVTCRVVPRALSVLVPASVCPDLFSG
jgi:diacylglycerol kinase family enzyme